MATYGGGIKVNANIAVRSNHSSNGTYTIYTAPATGYAIVNLNTGTFGGSATILNYTGSAGDPLLTPMAEGAELYVGPGAVITMLVTAYSGGTSFTVMTGLEFINA
jgi:hypothetical protein